MMDAANILEKAEFSGLVDILFDQKPASIAVALSGGADSMALCLLLNDWCEDHKISLHALSVDHGLRSQSAQEIEQVAAWLKARKINHHVLHWLGEKPSRGIQKDARIARYDLMGEWCAGHDIKHLFVAHHLDDQAETFLLRLFRGSGISGLSAMKNRSAYPVRLDHIAPEKLPELCRPLLQIPKSRLKATLCTRGQEWIEDPSNVNEDFMRVKIRKLLAQNDIEGLEAGRMAATADRMGRVQNLLEQMRVELARKALEVKPTGDIILDLTVLKTSHEEIALRLLASLCRMVSGGAYGPRMNKLQNLYDRLLAEDFSGQTLSGCRIMPLQAGKVHFIREERAIKDAFEMAEKSQHLWDGRFWIRSGPHHGLLRKLTAADWKGLIKELPDLSLDEIPPAVRYGLPCLEKEGGQVILPDLFEVYKERGIKAEYLEKIC